ncbi:MAG: TetR/AcrR family transcriptional regulator [Pseudomonadota bacterium]
MQRYFQQKALDLPKRDRTRALLMDGLICVNAETGIDALTVQQITRATGLAQGTFYNHFEDREDLVVHTAQSLLLQVHDVVLDRCRELSPGLQRMLIAVDATIDAAIEIPAHGKLLSDASGRFPQLADPIRKTIREDFSAGRRDNHIRVSPSRLLDQQIGALLGVSMRLRLEQPELRSVNRDTCRAVARLVGQTPDEAVASVAAALKYSRAKLSTR